MRIVVRLAVVIGVISRLGLSGFAVGYAVAEWAYLLALVAYVPKGGNVGQGGGRVRQGDLQP
jgi:hypothetical protein